MGGQGRCLREGDKLTVYKGEDGKLWLRFPDEFNDGRFEPLEAEDRGDPLGRRPLGAGLRGSL